MSKTQKLICKVILLYILWACNAPLFICDLVAFLAIVNLIQCLLDRKEENHETEDEQKRHS